MSTTRITDSGEGTRPTTDGAAGNLGPAKGYPDGDTVKPGPHERMMDKRQDAEAAEQDGSAPWGVRESMRPNPNTEPPPWPGKTRTGRQAPPAR